MAVAWTITDTRATDGNLTVLISGVPESLDRAELKALAQRTARKLYAVLEAASDPAFIREETLREGVSRGILSAAAARSLADLEDELSGVGT